MSRFLRVAALCSPLPLTELTKMACGGIPQSRRLTTDPCHRVKRASAEVFRAGSRRRTSACSRGSAALHFRECSTLRGSRGVPWRFLVTFVRTKVTRRRPTQTNKKITAAPCANDARHAPEQPLRKTPSPQRPPP